MNLTALNQFEKKLQYFAYRVSILASLEAGQKLTPLEAYRMMESLWTDLEQTAEQVPSVEMNEIKGSPSHRF
ncbi:MAG: hypothetical protein Q6L49_09440 [Thermostichales cyanobacterium HHBFW_bins_127]